LIEAGYTFSYPQLDQALQELLKNVPES
jgi:hypothetical protein